VIGLLPRHAPAWQVSVCVHAFASLHVVPSASGGMLHVPVLRSQAPAPWQVSTAVHTIGLPPIHTPFWQVSVCVHGSASLQAVPLGAIGFEHAPVAGSQVPATWHALEATQAIGLEPVQMPAWQVSVCVQALASLQAAPFARTGLSQVPVAGLQVPAVWH
jgi:hypothetical protein